jgi:hypothetical protein
MHLSLIIYSGLNNRPKRFPKFLKGNNSSKFQQIFRLLVHVSRQSLLNQHISDGPPSITKVGPP